MKLYVTHRAPNPRRVTIFLAEKGLDIPREEVDFAGHQHQSAGFSALNPFQQVPVLVLDDGTVLTETIAICRYFEELHPSPPLFGCTALERAQVEMWQRRMELYFLLPVAHVFRHSHAFMAPFEVPQIAEFAAANRPKVLKFLEFLNAELAERQFVCGDEFTIADITGLAATDFMKVARIALPAHLTKVARWHAALSARPSATA